MSIEVLSIRSEAVTERPTLTVALRIRLEKECSRVLMRSRAPLAAKSRVERRSLSPSESAPHGMSELTDNLQNCGVSHKPFSFDGEISDILKMTG